MIAIEELESSEFYVPHVQKGLYQRIRRRNTLNDRINIRWSQRSCRGTGYGIVHGYRKWWHKIIGVVIGMKSNFVQVDIISLVGYL